MLKTGQIRIISNGSPLVVPAFSLRQLQSQQHNDHGNMMLCGISLTVLNHCYVSLASAIFVSGIHGYKLQSVQFGNFSLQ